MLWNGHCRFAAIYRLASTQSKWNRSLRLFEPCLRVHLWLCPIEIENIVSRFKLLAKMMRTKRVFCHTCKSNDDNNKIDRCCIQMFLHESRSMWNGGNWVRIPIAWQRQKNKILLCVPRLLQPIRPPYSSAPCHWPILQLYSIAYYS